MALTSTPPVETIKLSAGTWIGIILALAVHASALVSWGITVEKRLTVLEVTIENQHDTVKLLASNEQAVASNQADVIKIISMLSERKEQKDRP